jgi:hypothetical protein
VRYRGREFSNKEVNVLKEMVASSAQLSRLRLSRLICEKLNWRMPDGRLKDAACRATLLQMEKDGVLTLPPILIPFRGKRERNRYQTAACDPGEEIICRADELYELRLDIAQSRSEKQLWSELIDRYHYLGYKPLGGAQLRYLIRSEGRVLGCIGWSAAAWKTAPRDQFIGWSSAEREKNLEKVINNARYLILPWVKVEHLASKALAMAAKRLPADWEKRYGYRPVLLETFVEKERFQGTCYKAANWIHVGETKGRGRYDQKHEVSQPIKTIWLYPLSRDFRKVLSS